jgi:hypothetical protein
MILNVLCLARIACRGELLLAGKFCKRPALGNMSKKRRYIRRFSCHEYIDFIMKYDKIYYIYIIYAMV